MALFDERTLDTSLPSEVIERLKTAESVAESNLQKIRVRVEPLMPAANKFLQSLHKPGIPKAQRVMGLRYVTKSLMKEVTLNSACRPGCSHCCHVLVGMTQTEADIIGKAIGRKPVKLTESKLLPKKDYGYHMPCTFLVDGSCSIYEHRPITCQVYFNLDADNLLCHLIPGKLVPLPLFNATSYQHESVRLAGDDVRGDIREFFPPKIG